MQSPWACSKPVGGQPERDESGGRGRAPPEQGALPASYRTPQEPPGHPQGRTPQEPSEACHLPIDLRFVTLQYNVQLMYNLTLWNACLQLLVCMTAATLTGIPVFDQGSTSDSTKARLSLPIKKPKTVPHPQDF